MNMTYFMSADGTVYAFDEEQIAEGYPRETMRAMSPEEVEAHTNPKPSLEDLAEAARAKRDSILSMVALRIAPLQDAVDLDEATSQEVLSLKSWKQYRIAVNRTTLQEGYPSVIEWPEQPQE